MRTGIQQGFFILLLILISSWSYYPVDAVHFVIEEVSQLKIEGVSNVTDFSCSCQCISEDPRSIQVDPRSKAPVIGFSDGRIYINTENLDCGKKAMNKDLYESMKSEKHPYIEIELMSAKSYGKPYLTNQWENFLATTLLTIAGEQRLVQMHVQGKQISENRYHFQGSQLIRMTDYGLQPPRPFMGLIKVDDEIRIFMDLKVKVLKE